MCRASFFMFRLLNWHGPIGSRHSVDETSSSNISCDADGEIYESSDEEQRFKRPRASLRRHNNRTYNKTNRRLKRKQTRLPKKLREVRDSWQMAARSNKRRDHTQQHSSDRHNPEHPFSTNNFTKNPLVCADNHAFTHDDDVSHVTLSNEIDEFFQSQTINREPCDSTDSDHESLSLNDDVTPTMFRNFIPRMGTRKIFSDVNVTPNSDSNYTERSSTTTL